MWEGSCAAWNLVNNRTNSAMQLFSHDLTKQSGVIFFNNAGRETVLEASVQEPWAPPSSASQ